MRNNLALALTSLKIWQTAKQLASISTYTDVVPIPYMTKYLAAFGRNPRKNWKMMEQKSALVRNRHSTYNQFLVDAEKSGAVTRLGKVLKHPRFVDILTYTTKLGDKGAIVAGMYAQYRYLTEVKGMTPDAAIRKAEIFSRNTQQTTETGSLTPAQRGGIVGRTSSMFTKSQQQYATATIIALIAGRAGKMSKAQAARTAVVIGVLTPMMWQFVAKAFSQDDEDMWDYALAPVDSFFAPVPLLGTTVSTVNNWISKGHNYGRDAITFIPTEQLNDILDDVNTIVNGVGDDIGMDEVLAGIDMFSKILNVMGAPGTTSKNILTGAIDVAGAENYQELLQGVMEMGGIGPSTAKKHSLVTGETIYNSE